MKAIKLYIQETYIELVQKVSWPSWKELQNSALLVMVASVIFAIVVLIMDKGFSYLVELIYGMFF